MKVLILSVTAGEGHNSTARAMKAEYERQGHTCTILDTFQYISPALAEFLSEGYLLVTEKAKTAYKVGYRLAEKRKGKSRPTTYLVDMAMADNIADFIATEVFDFVVFTHPFAGLILDFMKQKHMLSIPTFGILTDFTFHPYWENCTHNDYVFTPAGGLLMQARRKGFRDEQILPYGIPINPKFTVTVEKDKAREQLGLDPALSTILLMGGSMGYGNMAETLAKIDSLPMDFQIIAVCGNNAEMKAEVDGTPTTHRVLSTGFVDYVSLLMDASDCIVTKPGGLTTSESLAKGLPMVIVNPIPGQRGVGGKRDLPGRGMPVPAFLRPGTDGGYAGVRKGSGTSQFHGGGLPLLLRQGSLCIGKCPIRNAGTEPGERSAHDCAV